MFLHKDYMFLHVKYYMFLHVQIFHQTLCEMELGRDNRGFEI